MHALFSLTDVTYLFRSYHAINMKDYDVCESCYGNYEGTEIKFVEEELGKFLLLSTPAFSCNSFLSLCWFVQIVIARCRIAGIVVMPSLVGMGADMVAVVALAPVDAVDLTYVSVRMVDALRTLNSLF